MYITHFKEYIYKNDDKRRICRFFAAFKGNSSSNDTAYEDNIMKETYRDYHINSYKAVPAIFFRVLFE